MGPWLSPNRCWHVEHGHGPSPRTRHKLVLMRAVDSLAALHHRMAANTTLPHGSSIQAIRPEVRSRAAPRYPGFARALGIVLEIGVLVLGTWGVGTAAAREARRVSRARERRCAA